MINVACVKWGTMYSSEYVNVLYDMVRRNLAYGLKGRFVCFTDDPSGLDAGIETRSLPEGLSGWWNKLYLFSPEAFPDGQRVLYFDLDTAITGPIDFLASYQGEFAILRDIYRPNGLQSSVMAWEAGSMEGVWRAWNKLGRPDVRGGDQAYLEDYFKKMRFIPDKWQSLYPGRFCSYKAQARQEIPKNCSVVFFHGNPRPHEVKDGWVPHVWKVGGGSGVEFIVQANVSDEKLKSNVMASLKHCKTWIKREEGHLGTALIVAGGPSLKEQLFRVKGMQMARGQVFACGNAANYLLENGIIPENQVLLDARPENASFVVPELTVKYLSSQCALETWIKAKPAIGWHAMQTSYMDLVENETLIGGGTTVGLKALALTYMLGFRKFHLFGFDSCYRDDKHHAYPQELNDKERRVEVKLGDRTFECAPWMVTQAEEFKEIAPALVNLGCTLVIHGEGLIPAIAENLVLPPNAADVRAQEILKRLNGSKHPVGAEVGVFAGALSVRLLEHPELTLHMVDSWAEAKESSPYALSGDFHSKLSQTQQDKLYEDSCRVVSFAGERAKVRRLDSLEAARQTEDQSLDFVFLDADHSYEAVKADIDAWWPKVRPGGFLSGHDYDNPDFPLWGVKKAVTERFGSVDVGENFCWFVRKPEHLQ